MSRRSVGRDDEGAARGADAAQRRQVTVLFADMAGYTPLADKLGEENTFLLMQRVHRELSEAVHANDGTVQEMTGDGVMALFGAPVAIEDAPLRACRAALDIQSRMDALGGTIEAEHGARPVFRVGLHSGPLVIGAVGDDRKMEVTALGDTVNLASRIESEADSGAVLISEATQALVEGFVDSEFAGEHVVKGKPEPLKLWRLQGVRKGVRRFDVAQARGLTPLVGRSHELETLERVWRDGKDGRIRFVDIEGEAGIGKSRLVHEFRSRLDDGAFVLEGYCAADGQAVPFFPFADVVRRSFGFGIDAGQEEARRRLRRGLEILGLDVGDHLPYLITLLGYDPGDGDLADLADEVRGIRTRDAVVATLYERCRLTPTVVFIEDLHWMDSGTEALLTRVSRAEEALPLLVVTTYRPGYRPPWSSDAGMTHIHLEPLTQSGTADLVKERLGVGRLPDDLIDLVNEKAEGNPLFAEEITNYLLDSGSLRTEEDGLRFAPDRQRSVLPAGLENLLMDRVDRLDDGQRTTLEAASVLGQRFTPDLLGATTGLGDAVTPHLVALQDQELIFREPGQAAYRFKHALVRDAVYDGLMSSRRRTLHENAAVAIEETRGLEAADALATHWSRTERADKAIRYLALAGENSLRIYSLDEARQRLEAALALIEAHPDAVDDDLLTDILLHIARVHYFNFEFRSLIGFVDRYLPRVEALGDKKKLARFLFETGYAHVFSGRGTSGKALLERAFSVGEEANDELSVGYAALGLAFYYVWFGLKRDQAQENLERLHELSYAAGRRQRDVWLASKSCVAMSWGWIYLGRPGEARRAALKLMQLSRDTNDPRPRAMGLWTLSLINLFMGELEEAVANCDESLRLSISPIDNATAMLFRASARILSGKAEEEGAAISGFLELAEQNQSFVALHPALNFLGLSRVLTGRMSEGVRLVERARNEAAERGAEMYARSSENILAGIYSSMALGQERPPLRVVLRNLGFILRNGPFAATKARRILNALAEFYREQDRPSFLAQSLLDLGRLDAARNDYDGARRLFSEAQNIAHSVEADGIEEMARAALAKLPAG